MRQLELGFEPTALLSVEEIYQNATAKLIQELKEDRRLERKGAGVHAEHLGSIYFSMWANTVGGGLLVIGMSDDGRIEGCRNLSVDKLNDLERAGHQYCPDARYSSKRIPATRGLHT